jgi:SAM-dependent methyltransferase
MRAAEYELMHAVEDRHWWYAVLRSLVDDALAGRLPAHARLLDAGCGTGGMLAFLRGTRADVALEGVDEAEQAVRYCHRRGLAAVQRAEVEALPFEDAVFDAVMCLDVLYHAGVDEQRALAELGRVLRPQGLLLLNLPAMAALRGRHDEAVGGARRYEAGRVRALLAGTSFDVEMMHYWNAWLCLPLLIWRQLSRLKPHRTSDLNLTPVWMNQMLAGAGRVDAGLCRALQVPFGSSVFAVARKRNRSNGGMPHV